MLTNREDGGIHAFDDLAVGLERGAISRGKAIKLGGAALVASALGLFTSAEGAQAQTVEPEISRRKCNQKFRNADFCKNRQGNNCNVCCNRESRHPKACCGPQGCNCCRRREKCTSSGRCQ